MRDGADTRYTNAGVTGTTSNCEEKGTTTGSWEMSVSTTGSIVTLSRGDTIGALFCHRHVTTRGMVQPKGATMPSEGNAASPAR